LCWQRSRGHFQAIVEETEFDDIRLCRNCPATPEALRFRAVEFVRELSVANGSLQCELITGDSVVGGGAAPTTGLPTCEIAIRHQTTVPSGLRRKNFAPLSPPVICENLRRQGPSRFTHCKHRRRTNAARCAQFPSGVKFSRARLAVDFIARARLKP